MDKFFPTAGMEGKDFFTELVELIEKVFNLIKAIFDGVDEKFGFENTTEAE